jgi:hypothetical protein
MANLVDYLTQPLRKLFNTSDFKSAVKRYAKSVSPVSYPFQWYPDAGLTKEGPKFKYTDGTELISYHIKGISSISDNANSFYQYLGTVVINTSQGYPSIFPGNVTGMFQSGTGADIVTSPLALGGLIEIDGVHVPLNSFKISLYNYNNPEGFAWYALVVEGGVDASPGFLTALMSYDFEFLLPNFVPAPTIFQD